MRDTESIQDVIMMKFAAIVSLGKCARIPLVAGTMLALYGCPNDPPSPFPDVGDVDVDAMDVGTDTTDIGTDTDGGDVIETICGDGLINATDEQCDGTDLGDFTCESLGLEGELRCTADCTLDTDSCEDPGTCGDGVRSGMEACDGSDFGELNTCADFDSDRPYGTLTCA